MARPIGFEPMTTSLEVIWLHNYTQLPKVTLPCKINNLMMSNEITVSLIVTFSYTGLNSNPTT